LHTLFDDPLFALHIANLQDPEVVGGVTALCRAATTFRADIHRLNDCLPVLHPPDCEVALIVGRETAELSWLVKADIGVNGQANYQPAMLNVKLQAMGGPNFKPHWVSLPADTRPSGIPELEKLLGCKVVKRNACNSIAFPVHTLEQPVPTAKRLGYGEQTNFARAFKRWAGMTPP